MYIVMCNSLERAFAGPAYQDGDLVFCDQLGAPVSPHRLTEWFRRHRDAAGIPRPWEPYH